MPEQLQPNALLSLEEFYSLFKALVNSSVDDEDPDKQATVTWAINGVSTSFERFCNRRLKARDYSYDKDSLNYDPDYSIFDPPKYNVFFFPTYPVNSLTTFMDNGTVITASVDSLAIDGYVLYNKAGKLIYDQGFEQGYYKSIKAVWNGGYTEGSVEMSELQMLCFKMVNVVLQQKSNPMLQSETIGGYQYQLYSPTLINSMRGMTPDVYSPLGRYRRESIG
jgi:hypothetical protein